MYADFKPANPSVKKTVFNHGINNHIHRFIALKHLYPNLLESYGFPNLNGNKIHPENIYPRTLSGLATQIQKDTPEIFGEEHITTSGLKKLITRYMTQVLSNNNIMKSRKKTEEFNKRKKNLELLLNKNPQLNINQISEIIELGLTHTANQITQIINQKYNQNRTEKVIADEHFKLTGYYLFTDTKIKWNSPLLYQGKITTFNELAFENGIKTKTYQEIANNLNQINLELGFPFNFTKKNVYTAYTNLKSGSENKIS